MDSQLTKRLYGVRIVVPHTASVLIVKYFISRAINLTNLHDSVQ